jgi:hypothetical protein
MSIEELPFLFVDDASTLTTERDFILKVKEVFSLKLNYYHITK